MTEFKTTSIHKIVFLWCIFILCPNLYAVDMIPDIIQFGGMKLELSSTMQRQVEDHIVRLNQNYSQIKAQSSQMMAYLQTIEEILKKENIPTDFKYLAIQSMVVDAEGLQTNGFWKLNEEVAQKIGITVNTHIDDRFNLIASSQEVARYLRRNNLYFKNWLFTMLTLEFGFQDAKMYVLDKYQRKDIVGVQTLLIDERIHPFIRKFLTYKIFFEEKLHLENNTEIKLVQYTKGGNKTLSQIAKKFKISSQELTGYNQWLKRKRIPTDKVYAVIIPQKSQHTKKTPLSDQEFITLEEEEVTKDHFGRDGSVYEGPDQNPEDSHHEMNYLTQEDLQRIYVKQEKKYHEDQKIQEIIQQQEEEPPVEAWVQHDPIPVVAPQVHTVISGQTLYAISRMYDVSLASLRQWNNLENTNQIFPGQQLQLKNQNHTLRTPSITLPPSSKKLTTHKVQSDETLFSISKKYKISIDNLKKWNFLSSNFIQPGQELIVSSQHLRPILKASNTYSSTNTQKSFQKKISKARIIRGLTGTNHQQLLTTSRRFISHKSPKKPVYSLKQSFKTILKK